MIIPITRFLMVHSAWIEQEIKMARYSVQTILTHYSLFDEHAQELLANASDRLAATQAIVRSL